MTTVDFALHAAFATAAVTGTNGKTTTTSMIEAIAAAAGEATARVTTLGAWVNGEPVAEGPTLEAFANAVSLGAKAGIRTLALETTSRALAEGFAQRWPARVAVFTNLSRDHLDYHGDPEHYLAAKAQLFMLLPTDGCAVLNACDPASALLDEVTPQSVRRMAYAGSMRRVAPDCSRLPLTLAAATVEVGRAGTRARLEPGRLAKALGGELTLSVVGEHNVDNALGAALAAHALGYDAASIRRGLEGFTGVRGRFERVFADPLVVVDYAHTADALARTLQLARALAGEGNVVCVFGCGGGSDPGKRAEMGRVAAAWSDAVVVTSDNPREEDPAAIAQAVMLGAEEEARGQGRKVLLSELDRRLAILRGIGIARQGRGDIVVIAGKGHETTQWVGDKSLPFDDAEVARTACREAFERQDGK
ncbi:MAG: UDP-N-acetylmuramyl-tripeptide synthetase [Myxococcales bacterium]|nr:UDP-N-acetylmuramyl-tripeptide synthetase [Myxococcales bacterium]